MKFSSDKNIDNLTRFKQTIDPTVICNVSVIFIFRMIFVYFFLVPLDITFTDVALGVALRFPVDVLIGSGRSDAVGNAVVGGDVDVLKISNAMLFLKLQISKAVITRHGIFTIIHLCTDSRYQVQKIS